MSTRRCALLFLAALCAAIVPVRPAGASHIIDTGFRPARDGFAFPNWAGLNQDDALSSRHMLQLLRENGKCSTTIVGTYCDLRSGYRVTLDHLNEHLSAGRCEGMALLAARLFRRSTKLVHVSRTARTTHDLSRTEAADEIAYWWATQLAPNVQLYSASRRTMRPGDLVTEITRKMQSRVMVTLGIYSGDIAHTVLVTKATILSGRTVLAVYDPNFPGRTKNLVVNRFTDSWTYRGALAPDGTLVDLWGKGAGGLDYAPVSLRAHLSGWDRLGAF